MATALSKYNSPSKQKERKRQNGILTRSKAIWEVVRKEFSRVYCECYTVFISLPRVVLVERTAGRRIVCMQTGRHGHCMRLGIYGAAAGSEDTACLKSQGELPTALLLLSCDFLYLSKVIGFLAMSCLDVMYHQSYGAHYLPAAAYKATYYNHHQQQQQVRH